MRALHELWRLSLLGLMVAALLSAGGCPNDDDDVSGDDDTGDDDTGDDDTGDDDATPEDACDDTPNLSAVDDTVCAQDAACTLAEVALSTYQGYALAGGGDFDGDGLEDLVSGASGWTTIDKEGRALLYTAASFAKQVVAPVAYLEGADPLEKAGYSVAFAPDMDGDGLDELLVGARSDNDGGQAAGAVYVVHGQALTGTPTAPQSLMPDAAIRGEVDWGHVGTSVSGVRDATGDGRGEAALGFDLFTESGGFEFAGDGKVGVFFGQSGGLSGELTTGDADVVLEGPVAAGHVGYCLDGDGDVTGDGLGDLLIGAPSAETARGVLHIVTGPSLQTPGTYPIGELAVDYVGTDTSEHLGDAVGHLGDVDGDGIGDMAVGSPDSDLTWPDGGKVTVLRGSLDIDTGAVPEVLAEIGSEWDDFKLGGFTFSSYGGGPSNAAGVVGGDLDGDGLGDLVAGAVQAYIGPIMRGGRTYVFYGRTEGWDLLLDASMADGGIAGVSPDDYLGAGIATSDLDGDGIDELIVGAPYRDEAGGDSGAVYLFWGPTR